jgi:polar amino acid transport system substrate-binding protein
MQMMRSAVLGILLAAGTALAQQPIRTGIDATFAPHAMPKPGGGLEGFNIDLANELAKRMHRPIQIDGTEFSALIPGMNAKKYDFLIAPTTVTPERSKAMLFSEGYMETDYMFLQKKNDKDIKGFKYDVYGTNADAVQAVLSGRADANMAGHTVVLWAAKQNPAVKATYTYKTGLVWAMPFRLDDKEGRAQVNNILKCMKQDGTVARLYEKWFGIKPEKDSWVYKVAPGHGVPGMEGYDPGPYPPKC